MRISYGWLNGEVFRTLKMDLYDHIFQDHYVNDIYIIGTETRRNLVTGCAAVQHILYILTVYKALFEYPSFG